MTDLEKFVKKVKKSGGRIVNIIRYVGCNTASIPGVKMPDDGIGGYLPSTAIVIYEHKPGFLRKEVFNY